MKIYGFDFDETITYKDSTYLYLRFCYKRYRAAKRTVLKALWNGLLFKLGFRDRAQMKTVVFSFLKDVDAYESAELFWAENKDQIKQFYLERDRKDDVILSASPKFLLEGICKELGVKHLIATEIDIKTGKIEINNHGENKVVRLREEMPNFEMEEFYSDSKIDTPLAKLAKRAYLVRGDEIVDFFEG